MRKFLMAAAVLGVAACGEKTDGTMEDTTTVVTPPPAEQMGEMVDSMGAMVDSMKKITDSLADSTTQH